MARTTSIIRVSGVDAKDFLQGQLSTDLNGLGVDAGMLSAWCTPKGRVISLFTVTRDTNGYGMSVPAELAEQVVSRLITFRFRSKVEFNVEEVEATGDATAAIKSGIPWIGSAQTEKFTPHMLNLDLLDAISLDKGCYTGQEIVARTHYKGATKRRTMRFESEQPLSVGDKISADGRDIGEVLNVAGTQLLAVVAVDKAGGALSVNGNRLVLKTLPYLQL